MLDDVLTGISGVDKILGKQCKAIAAHPESTLKEARNGKDG